VLLDGLREQTSKFGEAAFVITVTPDGKPHATSVTVGWEGDLLTFGAGRTTLANAAERPDVALFWPPVEPGGYSLIVDGWASRRPGPGGEGLAVQPSKAVLHRAAPGSSPTGPPVSDCVTVLKQ
jgi:hypothetical protein